MKKVTIVQPSLRKGGCTEVICKYLEKKLQDSEIELTYIDLKDRELEGCDGRLLEEYSQQLQVDYQTLKCSDLIIFGFPIYHFAITGVLKNYIDIMGDALEGKKIDFLVSAIYTGCDMAYEHILESLMAKYSVEKFSKDTVYVINKEIMNGKIMSMKALKQINTFVKNINNL